VYVLATHENRDMKHLLLILCTVLALNSYSQPTHASNDNKIQSNGVFVEGYLLGNHDGSVGWFSLNYNRKVGKKKFTVLRTGVSSDFRSSFGVPLVITWISNPTGKHHFEGGVGVNSRLEIFEGVFHYDPFGMMPAMYRFESSKGFLLRAGINYFWYSYAIWYPVSLQLGVSLGYAF
jgi:hypothetical protein